MGKRLEALAPDFDLNPTLILDDHNNKNGDGITTEAFEKMDAAIDFSHPEAFTTNLHKVFQLSADDAGTVVKRFERSLDIAAREAAWHEPL